MPTDACPDEKRDRVGSLTLIAGCGYVASTLWESLELPIGTMTQLTGLAFIAFWCIDVLMGRRRPILTSAYLLLLSLIFFWSIATTYWSYAPVVSMSTAVSVLALGVSSCVIADVFRDRLETLTVSLIVGATPLALFTLAQSAEYVEQQGVVGRTTFADFDQNTLAFYLAVGLAACFYVMAGRRTRIASIAVVLPAVLCAMAIIKTGSKTGVVALILVTVLGVVMSSRSLPRALLAGTAAVLGLYAYQMMLSSSLVPSRVQEFLASPQAMDSRTEIINQYLQSWPDWLLQGVGAGADAEYLRENTGFYLNAHGGFWKLLIETGLVGMLLWAALLAVIVTKGLKSPGKGFLLLALPVLACFMFTLGPWLQNVLWVVVGVALMSPEPLSHDEHARQGHASAGSGASSDSGPTAASSAESGRLVESGFRSDPPT